MAKDTGWSKYSRNGWHRFTSGIMSLVSIGEERLWGDCEANLGRGGRDRSSV